MKRLAATFLVALIFPIAYFLVADVVVRLMMRAGITGWTGSVVLVGIVSTGIVLWLWLITLAARGYITLDGKKISRDDS